MAKETRSRAAAEAARRAAARARELEVGRSKRTAATAQDLRDVSAWLRRSEAELALAIADRDRMVRELRAAGWSWSAIASAAGVSRQALAKRQIPEPSA